MTTSPLRLLGDRRFGPLFVTQTLGAVADNLVKNALVVLALFSLAEHGPIVVALAGGLFILPDVVLSATAGQLADRQDKAQLIRWTKWLELGLMCVSAAGFLLGSVALLLLVLLGLGLQATLFSPLKFAILPDHLREEELIEGNGLLEAGTFLGILAGTIAGGALIALSGGGAIVAAAGLACSVAGLLAAFRIPPTRPSDPGLRIEPNVLRETLALVRQARGNRPVWLSILGLGWFWTVGATLLSAFPVVAKETLGGSAGVITLLLTVFAVGVGIGSVLCARLLRGEVTPRLVPFASLAITVFGLDFAVAAWSAGAAGGLASPGAVLSSFAGWRLLIDLFLLAAAGGLYSVPLYAIIQGRSPPEARSRMFAANNVIGSGFMVAGAAVFALLAALGWDAPAILVLTAALNVVATVIIVGLIPQDTLRQLFRWYFDQLHGVEVRGLEHYRAAGERVVIVSNHLSFLDACLIATYLPDSPTFAIHTRTAGLWWVRPFIAAVDTFKVDVQSPYAIKHMVAAMRDQGRKLMIFPEGRLTKTGGLMKVYEGAGVVADKAGAKVVPVAIDGPQYTRLGHMRGKLTMRWFPRLCITIMPPVDLSAAVGDRAGKPRRQAVKEALRDALVRSAHASRDTSRTLFAALLDARDLHGAGRPALEDLARQPLPLGRVAVGAVALGARLRAGTAPGEIVGLLLPNANGAVVAFMALQAEGRVPAMLNPTAGAAGALAACEAAGIRTILSSRRFVEKGGKAIAAVAEALAARHRLVWLEEERAAIGGPDRLRALLTARFAARRLAGATADPDGPAVVLFTSGSEGTPKGVVLSHRNILSNCAQLAAVIDFHGGDIVFNAMPMFHSFGLTGGTLLPLLNGVRIFLYPSPLHYRIVPGLAYDTDATILFGTDTFLSGWAKHADPQDFYSVRYAFSGAERVRDETRRLYAERFGVRILEGYGATETAPAISINTAAHNRPGTVGRLLPGIEARLEPVAGVEGAGRLLVRGPNVMLGYLRVTSPGVIEPVAEGWYDTGDIVAIDAEGFLTIRGRAKRFAKIAGEMASMTAAEALAESCWPGAAHGVVAVPDPRKGEALVLATTAPGAEARTLLAHARERGVPELLVPRIVLALPAIPLLGTGKTDYPALEREVRARLAEAVPA
jgi:acyl-[acyl-carrier-protein]-phospholipid O-acyltransferase/long-chain-fatty-acid--[acyl-carrier-protein] ligase